MSGTIPFRWFDGTGGSSYSAADVRSAATAAACGAQAPALQPREDRSAAAGADQQPGQGDASSGAELSAEPRSLENSHVALLPAAISAVLVKPCLCSGLALEA